MRHAIAATVVILLPAVIHGQALPSTVAEMQRACRIVSGELETAAPEDAVAAGACYGTMRGVVQVMQANCRSFAAGQRPGPALSAGEIPSAGDAMAAFEAWAEEHPDEAGAPAEYGVIAALAQAFPCRPSMPGPAPTSDEPMQESEPGENAGASEEAPPE